MQKTNRMIYLDYNATAPLRSNVKQAMVEAMGQPYNASSTHKSGRHARMVLENARDQILSLLSATSHTLVFTSGATEANNMALHGLEYNALVASAIEHPAILMPAQNHAVILSVDSNGIIDLNHLEELAKAHPAPTLFSIMVANNETGVIQPIQEAAKIIHEHGHILHCDAVQAFGRIPVDVKDLDIDMLSISAHKIGGPTGIGALVFKKGLDIAPLIHGGGQEQNKRGGTENVIGALGFSVAAQDAVTEILNFQKLNTLRDRMEKALCDYSPELVFHGQNAPRLSNTSLFSLPDVPSSTQMIHMDLAGIAVSNGSACSSGRVEPSHVLNAMGVSDEHSLSSLRVSMGWDTTESDISAFIDAWKELYDRVKSRMPQ